MEGKVGKLLKEGKPDPMGVKLKGQTEINLGALLKGPMPLHEKMEFPMATTILDMDTIKALAEHLHELLRHGDAKTARSFLNCFIKMERKRIVTEKVNGKTALFTAVSNHMTGVMSYLIEECTAVVDQHSEGNDDTTNKICTGSSLAYAASTNNIEAAQILIDYGANVNGPTSTGLTPVLCACFKGDRDMVKFLVEAGADINIPDQGGFTCLMHAYMNGDIELAKFLLSHGTSINIQCHKGLSALHYAAQNNNTDLVRLLLKHGADLNMQTRAGNTALHVAIEKGHVEMVRQLVDSGADLYVRNAHNEDSVLFAAYCGAEKVLKYLLDKHISQRQK